MAIILDWTTTKSGKYGQIALGELIAHITAIIVVSAILCLPLLSVGVFTGAYDAPTHALYQYYFSRQFWNGDFYPRWLAEANKGYGSPVFLIQYPFPYFITALLRPILSFAQLPPAKHMSSAFIASSFFQARALLRGFGFVIASHRSPRRSQR
jgi:hypothetical protein